MDCIRSDLGPMTVVGSGPAYPGMIGIDSSVESIGSYADRRRQQAPVTVVTSTRLAHGPVVDSCYGPAAAGMIARSRNPDELLFDPCRCYCISSCIKCYLCLMTVAGSRPAFPGMIARSKA